MHLWHPPLLVEASLWQPMVRQRHGCTPWPLRPAGPSFQVSWQSLLYPHRLRPGRRWLRCLTLSHLKRIASYATTGRTAASAVGCRRICLIRLTALALTVVPAVHAPAMTMAAAPCAFTGTAAAPARPMILPIRWKEVDLMIHVDDFPLGCLRVCCGFYDRDIGCCLCPPLEMDYACPLSDAEELNACLGEGGGADA